MANELGVYQLIKNILADSMVIGGRFVVLKEDGTDVNSTNFGQIVTDALSGFVEVKKYPAVVMLPPYESEEDNDKDWSTWKIDMFFLCLNKRTGDGDIKQPDTQTNTSTHTYQMDWKDMRECAGNFRKMLRNIIRVPPFPNTLREKRGALTHYSRVTMKSNDAANGIRMTFELQLYDNYCTLADYSDNGASIVIPDNFAPHPLHKR